jgi:transcriptional regulator with XRE-family HTH domain
MADFLGLTQAGYSLIEQGLRRPNADHVLKLAKRFGTSPESILYGEEQPASLMEQVDQLGEQVANYRLQHLDTDQRDALRLAAQGLLNEWFPPAALTAWVQEQAALFPKSAPLAKLRAHRRAIEALARHSRDYEYPKPMTENLLMASEKSVEYEAAVEKNTGKK